jgi:hypothetical protein
MCRNGMHAHSSHLGGLRIYLTKKQNSRGRGTCTALLSYNMSICDPYTTFEDNMSDNQHLDHTSRLQMSHFHCSQLMKSFLITGKACSLVKWRWNMLK